METPLQFSDIHIHSRFARATSKHLNYPNLYYWAKLKGINILGTGDILHPQWREEAQNYLEYDEESGFYKLKGKYALAKDSELPKSVRNVKVRFIPTVETSHIYKQDDRLRRIHIVIVFPNLHHAQKLADKLSTRFNLISDGRPIFGINVRDFTETVLEQAPNAIVIPAHIWTPHFSLFGSKSGFDSIQEAFGDMTPYIKTLETGLSSDPEMNRLVKQLDDFILTSNSDSHSLERIGREANIHTDYVKDYETLYDSLTTGKGLHGTIEYFPEEGRYHYDGHRNCKISMHPKEAIEHQLICPKCNKPLTIGVLHRVYELAQGNTKPNNKLLNRFKSIHIVPLDDILSALLKTGRTSKKVRQKLLDTITHLGPELQILTQLSIDTIMQYDPLLGLAIQQMREGKLRIIPGYDGEYGTVSIDTESLQKTNPTSSQLSLI